MDKIERTGYVPRQVAGTETRPIARAPKEPTVTNEMSLSRDFPGVVSVEAAAPARAPMLTSMTSAVPTQGKSRMDKELDKARDARDKLTGAGRSIKSKELTSPDISQEELKGIRYANFLPMGEGEDFNVVANEILSKKRTVTDKNVLRTLQSIYQVATTRRNSSWLNTLSPKEKVQEAHWRKEDAFKNSGLDIGW